MGSLVPAAQAAAPTGGLTGGVAAGFNGQPRRPIVLFALKEESFAMKHLDYAVGFAEGLVARRERVEYGAEREDVDRE